jgi:hypothetical protein
MSPIPQAPPAVPPTPSDEFFIGWLKPPAGYARWMRGSAACCAILAVASAGVWAWWQQSPGSGHWETEPRTFRGVVESSPYALLHTTGDGGEPRSMLLVSSGKLGAAQRMAPWHGRAVEVTGTLLERDGRAMLELIDTENAVVALDSGTVLPRPVRRSLGSAALIGEVIDPKCYLGAMKPGGGVTHRGCAVLCIRGGVPPMLAIRDPGQGGRERFVLLMLADSTAAGEALLPFVGDRIQAEGQLELWGDLPTLRVDLTKTTRIE